MRLKSGKLPVKFPRTFRHRTMGWCLGFSRKGEWVVDKSTYAKAVQRGGAEKQTKNDTF